jgi:hypothetical protein
MPRQNKKRGTLYNVTEREDQNKSLTFYLFLHVAITSVKFRCMKVAGKRGSLIEGRRKDGINSGREGGLGGEV